MILQDDGDLPIHLFQFGPSKGCASILPSSFWFNLLDFLLYCKMVTLDFPQDVKLLYCNLLLHELTFSIFSWETNELWKTLLTAGETAFLNLLTSLKNSQIIGYYFQFFIDKFTVFEAIPMTIKRTIEITLRFQLESNRTNKSASSVRKFQMKFHQVKNFIALYKQQSFLHCYPICSHYWKEATCVH